MLHTMDKSNYRLSLSETTGTIQNHSSISKEMECFSSTTPIANLIQIWLPVDSMHAFKSFIHNSLYVDKLPLFDMVPGKLARV